MVKSHDKHVQSSYWAQPFVLEEEVMQSMFSIQLFLRVHNYAESCAFL